MAAVSLDERLHLDGSSALETTDVQRPQARLIRRPFVRLTVGARQLLLVGHEARYLSVRERPNLHCNVQLPRRREFNLAERFKIGLIPAEALD